jgi:hypothetical protein
MATPLSVPEFVFGLLMIDKPASIVACKRQDGVWILPGGPVPQGMDPKEVLEMLVLDQTGYEVRVYEQIGPDHMIDGKVAKAFECVITGQGKRPSIDIASVDEVGLEEWKACSMPEPQNRMGFDAFSILQQPFSREPKEQVDGGANVEGVFVSDDGSFLIDDRLEERKAYRRIDPSTESGYMELPK